MAVLEFKTIDSTNDYLKVNHQILPNHTVLRADFQSKGRGQFDRTWEANPNENLLFSYLLKDVPISKLGSIKQQVINHLQAELKTYQVDAVFKAPNDLYVQDKKLIGILIETQIKNQQFAYVIIGIGLNVNQTDFQEPNAISLKMILQTDLDINKLFQSYIKLFQTLN